MWRVQLEGDEKSLEILRKNFKNYIRLDDAKYYLICPKFETLDTSKLLGFAEEKIQQMLYILNLHLVKPCNVTVQKAFENIHEDGKDILLYPEPITSTFSMSANLTVTDRNGNIVETTGPDPQVVPKDLETSLKVINKNQYIQKALYFNKNPNWYNLIKVWELIEEDMGNKSEIVNKGWANSNEIDLFRCTAHNPEGAGLDARHAVSKIRKDCKKILSVQDPMELSVAINLMKKLLNEWIDFHST